MSTKTGLLELLRDNRDRFLSGQKIASELGISRNAVWKAVNALKNDGYRIESRTKVGYKLYGGDDPLTHSEISKELRYDCELRVLEQVTSTNDLAKDILAEREGSPENNDKPLVVIANKQTRGKGRMGRSFESPAGTGIYMSIAIRPRFDIGRSLYVTMAAAVAVCRVMESVCDVRPRIKWVNDIFVSGKKVCGILTEAQAGLETGTIDSLIIGIGINCFPGSFPPEIADIAGALAEEPDAFSRNELAAGVIDRVIEILGIMDRGEFLDEYRNRCMILGKEVEVRSPYGKSDGLRAKALDISDDGGLVVEYLSGDRRGQKEILHSGEVSVAARRYT